MTTHLLLGPNKYFKTPVVLYYVNISIVLYRVRANSEKIRIIFERTCIELWHFMRNSRNSNMVERENGFRLQKCCPCRTGAFDTQGYKFVSFLTCRYVPPLFITLSYVCLYVLFIYLKAKSNNGCIFYPSVCQCLHFVIASYAIYRARL